MPIPSGNVDVAILDASREAYACNSRRHHATARDLIGIIGGNQHLHANRFDNKLAPTHWAPASGCASIYYIQKHGGVATTNLQDATQEPSTFFRPLNGFAAGRLTTRYRGLHYKVLLLCCSIPVSVSNCDVLVTSVPFITGSCILQTSAEAWILSKF